MNATRAIAGVVAAVLGVVVGPIASGCRSSAPPPLQNLVLVNIDTLRADHLGCYGYARDTSPFLDRLAREGVRFPNARANSSFTRESVAALFTGKLPSTTGAAGWNAKPPAGDDTLGRLLERAGYVTGFFSATTVLTDPRFTQGFQTARQLTEAWGVSGLGPKLSDEAVAFAAAAAGRPFAMYLHYLDPHGPYRPTEAHYRKLASAPFARPLDIYADVRPRLAELRAEGFGPGEARFEDQVARYDAEIADTDAALAQLFDGLQRLDVLDRTLVVVTADHGEELLEHGFVEHAWTLYEEVLRVPLIVWPARALPGVDATRAVATVDVLPTVLDVLAVAGRPEALDGVSVLAPAQRPVVAELLIAERNVVRAVVDGDWKYVAAGRWLTPDERPAAARVENEVRARGDTGTDPCVAPVREELYDLAADAREQRDLAAAAPDVLGRLRAALEPSLAACRRNVRRLAGAAAAGPDEADRQRLRALGYVE